MMIHNHDRLRVDGVDLTNKAVGAPENWGRDLGGSSRKSAAHAETVANLAID